MLEIIAVIFLARRNGRVAAEKGYSRGGYIWLTIALWVGCEIIGGIIGFVVSPDIAIYILALLGAVIGGVISYLIVSNLKLKLPEGIPSETDKTDIWTCPQCGHQNTSFDKEYCFKCKSPRPGF